ncbi:substrate-binding periplasmic protein [Pseudobacteriovorax antillogorgiicola]|uniref:ABC-type amino acid transport substrate-binding protein n=1 Tax=Pseudobacteriovorax antillogorgiicola TaxID=1513793 RepID=A0A1Y6CDW4_9BACT|nr:transporter substrate-binding domain-containing protein [Pseudobacteriovorax antillogorgiicola]TCS47962.1 ABC-type amino acid transport substrate-binding protein [Pseudobacteriovorax antillogorgiicola]SMF58185.1 ABC-type amino acid transport substrate-binding protein [Pseudobacteriovorax antillogorgiicola]
MNRDCPNLIKLARKAGRGWPLLTRLTAIYCLMVLIPNSVSARERQRGQARLDNLIGTFKIPGLVEADQSGKLEGVFVQLARQVVLGGKPSSEIILLPPKRVKYLIAKNMLLGFFPATERMEEGASDKYCRSTAFAEKLDYVYFLNNTKPAHSMRDLKGKRVLVTAGYPYDPKILKNPDVEITFGVSDEASLKMLNLGRVDYFIGEELSAAIALEKLGYSNIRYNNRFPVGTEQVFFVFLKTKEGLAQCEKVNQRLIDLKGKGLWDWAAVKQGILKKLGTMAFQLFPGP